MTDDLEPIQIGEINGEIISLQYYGQIEFFLSDV